MTVTAILPQVTNERADGWRWFLAAGIVFVAHLGIIASVWLLIPVQSPGRMDLPAVTIELAPLNVAPTIQRDDMAIGPELQPPQPDAAVPKSEAREPQAKLDLIPAPNPAATLSQPKPKEEPKAPAHAQRLEQMAPPKAEQKAHAPAAPNAGSKRTEVVPPSWIRLLLAHLNRHKQYPPPARARREEGVVMLSFTMDRSGHVLAQNIAKSSGSPALDAEALAMLARSAPLPAFPADMTDQSRSFKIPIRFSLR